MKSFPCIICDKSLENISEDYNQPSKGLEFFTYGHYGSTFFDPMNGEKLICNICDECAKKKFKNKKIKKSKNCIVHYMNVYDRNDK